jgi:hypothetical protein
VEVRKITRADAIGRILNDHYAHRIPSISYAFGLFDAGLMCGVVTYGTPPSAPLRSGICGPEYASIVLELNRLVIDKGAPANGASHLIGRSLRLLPRPRIVVSFADTGAGHIGYVYQATNAIYTGLSAKRTDWKIRGEEHLHGATIADRSRGKPDRAKWMKEVYGDRFYLSNRPQKHRYIYFVGCSKKIRQSLRYPVMQYPKGNTTRHDSTNRTMVEVANESR